MKNTTDQLKNLGLTDEDFQMLSDGLDALPEKGEAAALMMDVISMSMLKTPEDRQAYVEKEKIKTRQRFKEKEAKMEGIRILQGKILSLKRLFCEQSILNEAQSIINPEGNE